MNKSRPWRATSRRDCEADGRLSLVLEVEHFITCSDGRAANFAAVQAAMQDMQQQADAPIIVDGTYMGYSGLAASVTWGLRASSGF